MGSFGAKDAPQDDKCIFGGREKAGSSTALTFIS